jgi:predicted membrane metal-binding protein
MLQLVVAYLFGSKFTALIKPLPKNLWKGSFCLLLVAGLLSCGTFIQSQTWWNKDMANTDYQLAQIINKSEKPLLVSDVFYMRILSLRHQLNNDAQFLLVKESEMPSIPAGLKNVFLYSPTAELKQALESSYTLKSLTNESESTGPTLWQVTSKK